VDGFATVAGNAVAEDVVGIPLPAFFDSPAGQMTKKILLGFLALVAFITTFPILLPAYIAGAFLLATTLVINYWDRMMNFLFKVTTQFLDWLRRAVILTGKIVLSFLFPLAGLYIFRDEIFAVFQGIGNYIKDLPFVQRFIEQFISIKEKLSSALSGIFESLKVTFQALLPTGAINGVIEAINFVILKLNEFSTNPIVKGLGISPLNISLIPKLEQREFGGPIEAGIPYIVGERGPELRVFNQSGSIVPNNQLVSNGESSNGSSQIIFNANFTVNGTNAESIATDVWQMLKQLGKDNANEIRFDLGMRPA
jgi:hypothetical protein